MPCNRQIIFTSRKIPNNSFQMRGVQIAEAMAAQGYNTRCADFRTLKDVKGAIIVWVRRCIEDPFGLVLPRLIRNGNVLIYDPLDRINFEPPHKLMHAVIYPSKVQYLSSKTDKVKYVVKHHWDKLLDNKCYNRDHFELGYWGYRTSAVNVFNFIPRGNALTSARNLEYPADDWFKRVSCHYSIRDEQRGYGWRPTTKISTAAAVGCNIVVSRDTMSEELLPKDYPYFVDGYGYDDTQKMIEFARLTYNTDIWRYGLECMAKVKKYTSVDRCAKLYGNIFNDLCERFK